jgi:hypothetical protein
MRTLRLSYRGEVKCPQPPWPPVLELSPLILLIFFSYSLRTLLRTLRFLLAIEVSVYLRFMRVLSPGVLVRGLPAPPNNGAPPRRVEKGETTRAPCGRRRSRDHPTLDCRLNAPRVRERRSSGMTIQRHAGNHRTMAQWPIGVFSARVVTGRDNGGRRAKRSAPRAPAGPYAYARATVLESRGAADAPAIAALPLVATPPRPAPAPAAVSDPRTDPPTVAAAAASSEGGRDHAREVQGQAHTRAQIET